MGGNLAQPPDSAKLAGHDKADLVLRLVSRENTLDDATHRKTHRARTNAFQESASRPWPEAQPENEGASNAAGKNATEERAACAPKNRPVA